MSEVLLWKEVKTRKPHKCYGCSIEYPKNIKMIYATYVDEEGVFSTHWCKTCDAYITKYFDRGDETGEGEILQSDPERWHALHEELINE